MPRQIRCIHRAARNSLGSGSTVSVSGAVSFMRFFHGASWPQRPFPCQLETHYRCSISPFTQLQARDKLPTPAPPFCSAYPGTLPHPRDEPVPSGSPPTDGPESPSRYSGSVDTFSSFSNCALPQPPSVATPPASMPTMLNWPATTNSSPPNLPFTSVSRKHASTSSPVSARYDEPVLWPRSSLILFKPIQVDEHHRERQFRALRETQRLLAQQVKATHVVETGEVVAQSEVVNLLFHRVDAPHQDQ